MTKRLKVGVVGAGIIAQVMHLHYLRELADHFEVVALCDIAPENAEVNAASYAIPMVFNDWREMLAEAPIDAVVILTSGSHCPMAVEAAKAGKHVLVEKPMCFSVTEGKQMRDAADEASVVLMVAYPKRYDPAFERFREEVAGITDPRLLRVTTFEAPFLPYVRHYPLAPVAPVPVDAIDRWQAETAASITTAIGEADEFLRKTYHYVLVDSLVHELNTLRAAAGRARPSRLCRPPADQSHRPAPFRQPAGLHSVARPARFHQLHDGVRVLWPRQAGHAELSVALPAQCPDLAGSRRWRQRNSALVAHRGGHLVRQCVQGGATGVPRMCRRRPRTDHRCRRRDA